MSAAERLCRCRESLVLYHGRRAPFLLSFPADLGDVGTVNVRWEYDRRLTDLLNPMTACLPIFCSDGLFVDRVRFSQVRLECRRGDPEAESTRNAEEGEKE